MQVSTRATLFEVTTGTGRGADSYVQGSAVSTNFGASGLLTTRSNAGNASNNYKVYLRFDLSSLAADLSQATSATLKFSTISANTGIGFSFFAVPDGLPGDSATGWTESGITYTNAPGTPASITNLGFITAPGADENGNYVVALGSLTGLTTGGGAQHSFSTSSLLDLVKSDTNGLLTIALNRNDTKGIIHIASDENTSGFLVPTLVIDTPSLAAVPEPGTGLIGLGLLGLGIFRRKRARA